MNLITVSKIISGEGNKSKLGHHSIMPGERDAAGFIRQSNVCGEAKGWPPRDREPIASMKAGQLEDQDQAT
ncbi:MAG: hypothetical protein DRH97_06595 [Chloroflexi bacterium]|nr:MAG: hypothetical protein DRH97_06595 [Chloroflexota bacterium]